MPTPHHKMFTERFLLIEDFLLNNYVTCIRYKSLFAQVYIVLWHLLLTSLAAAWLVPDRGKHAATSSGAADLIIRSYLRYHRTAEYLSYIIN
jgi:hypothetical protein